MGSMETTFYTLTVYFGCVGIKKSRNTVASTLITDVVAVITSIVLINFFK